MKSRLMWDQAKSLIAGGVTSAVRAGALPHPLYFDHGAGPFIWDVDGNRYVDFVLGYGPLFLGHCPKPIVDAVREQAARGSTFGAQHRLEVDVARLLTAVVPGAERVVLSTTGTEAVVAALRIARAATRRPKILKFEGHYHGWSDAIYVNAVATDLTHGSLTTTPGTCGIPPTMYADTLVCPWNDFATLESMLELHGDDVAAVIVEPLAVNPGVIPPAAGFLPRLRELTRRRGICLIFDEVITGFRLALGGAQEYFEIRADLAVFGKALGAGFAISAVAGSREWMRPVETGELAHMGTFNGNPVGCAAAVATLEYLTANRSIYSRLERLGEMLATGLRSASPDLCVRQVGPILQTAFGEPTNVLSIRDRARGDKDRQREFAGALLRVGIHSTPRGLWYLSTAHSESEVGMAVKAAATVLTPAVVGGLASHADPRGAA